MTDKHSKDVTQKHSDDLRVTTLSVSIYRNGENPIYGKMAIRVELKDEAAGPFLELSSSDTDENQPLRIELDELQMAWVQGKRMIDEYNASIERPQKPQEGRSE